jgi:hypothetical protein
MLRANSGSVVVPRSKSRSVGGRRIKEERSGGILLAFSHMNLGSKAARSIESAFSRLVLA